jgi:hypothetical protein
MKNEVTFRTFKEGDYEMCCEWWKWWWDGEIQRRQFLPIDTRCFVIESNDIPVAAGFLFVDGNMGYLTYVVSNPEYREADRRQILEQLVNCIEREAKEQWGVEFILTVCGNVHMENIHNKLGWYVDKTAPAYETIKYL